MALLLIDAVSPQMDNRFNAKIINYKIMDHGKYAVSLPQAFIFSLHFLFSYFMITGTCMDTYFDWQQYVVIIKK